MDHGKDWAVTIQSYPPRKPKGASILSDGQTGGEAPRPNFDEVWHVVMDQGGVLHLTYRDEEAARTRVFHGEQRNETFVTFWRGTIRWEKQ